MTELDIETGLPKLPEGYFWRIEKYNPAITPRVAIAIMRESTRRKWFKTVEWAYEFSSVDIFAQELEQSADPEGWVLELAKKVYDRAVPKWRAESQVQRVEFLYGDYPPKKLVLKDD